MFSQYNINENITLYKRDEIVLKNTQKLIDEDSNSMAIEINLSGKGSYNSLLSDYKIDARDNHTVICNINSDKGIIKEEKSTIQSIQIAIKKDFLKQNLPDEDLKEKILNFFQSNNNVENISYQKTNPKTKIIALELLNNQYTNRLEKLFLESKTLELIYNEFSNLFQNNTKKYNRKIYLSAQDKEAIYNARDILINNMANPPSIKELSKMVSTNELKIKTGFHKYFNDTPYNMLLEYKMQEAKKLLENSDLNINEISQQLGYKYHQNFSKAFIKRFGIVPRELMKSRKYYY